jgi:hypothetical protein
MEEGENWIVSRRKGGTTEYLGKNQVWHEDKKDAHLMHEEFAKGTINGLQIVENGRKEADPFRYESEYYKPQSG